MLFCKILSNPTVLSSLLNNLPLNRSSNKLVLWIDKYQQSLEIKMILDYKYLIIHLRI